MHRVEPKVFLIGNTQLCQGNSNTPGLHQYLTHIGVPDWDTNAPSDSEKLIEIMGRLCYRSFAPLMNPNVTKVREGNDIYIANIVKQMHGSVIEHAYTNWIFADVSRVFTHELCRHRVGTAFSQESLRYVRLSDLGLWLPTEVEHDPKLVEIFETTFKNLEQLQIEMAKYLNLDDNNFHIKKTFTSAMRRLAPEGLATTIGFSCNFRTLRHLIELRTSEAAEAEIRYVFNIVATITKQQWPNVFADFAPSEKMEWKPQYSKI